MLQIYECIFKFFTLLVPLKMSIQRIVSIRNVMPLSLLRNSKVFMSRILVWPLKETVAKFITGYSAPLFRKRCLYSHGFVNLKFMARNSKKYYSARYTRFSAAWLCKGRTSKIDKNTKGKKFDVNIKYLLLSGSFITIDKALSIPGCKNVHYILPPLRSYAFRRPLASFQFFRRLPGILFHVAW